MKPDALEAYFSVYSENEKQAMEFFRQSRITGDSALIYRFYPPFTAHKENVALWTERPIRFHRHERYVYKTSHTHNRIEIMYQFSGQCVQSIGNTTITLSHGQFCFLPPGVFHMPNIFDDSVLLNLLIEREVLEEICTMLNGTDSILARFFDQIRCGSSYPTYLLLDPAGCAETERRIREMIAEYYTDAPLGEQMIRSQLLSLMIHLIRTHERDIIPSPDIYRPSNALPPILSYINDHFTTVTLTELAQVFHYNEQYICRLIHRHTGCTFTDIITEHRLNYAKSLLLSSNQSFAQIAAECGFQGDAYFHRTFRRYTGMTPMQFRQFYESMQLSSKFNEKTLPQ